MWFFPFVFKNAMMIITEKYACFQGRADRWEYWCWALFRLLLSLVLACVIAGFVIGFLFGNDPAAAEGVIKISSVFALIGIVIELGLLLPSLAVSVRRLHDTNRSGWWLLISLIPYLGGLILLILLVLPGNFTDNKYGVPVMR